MWQVLWKNSYLLSILLLTHKVGIIILSISEVFSMTKRDLLCKVLHTWNGSYAVIDMFSMNLPSLAGMLTSHLPQSHFFFARKLKLSSLQPAELVLQMSEIGDWCNRQTCEQDLLSWGLSSLPTLTRSANIRPWDRSSHWYPCCNPDQLNQSSGSRAWALLILKISHIILMCRPDGEPWPWGCYVLDNTNNFIDLYRKGN